MPEPPEFRRVLEVLLENSVEIVVIGGVAMALHGSAHLTRDIDFVYARDRSNLEALATSLAPFHPALRGAPAELPFRWDSRTLELGLNFTLSTDLGDLDLLGLAPGAPPYAELRERAEVMNVRGLSVPVASLDDLLSMKRAANRPKDRDHVRELEALRRLKFPEL